MITKATTKGQALIIVLIIVALLGGVLTVVMMQQSRSLQISKGQNDDTRFREITRRMQNILEARALCTCNLKDLIIEPAGTNPDGTLVDGSAVMIEEGEGIDPEVFGFYKLDPLAADGRGCKFSPGNIDYQNDSVLIMRPSSSYLSGVHVRYIKISQFQLWQDFAPTIKRYKAKFSFVAKDNFSVAKSNLASPIDLDVFVEVASGPGGNIIKQCFQPRTVPAPQPNPPSSPPYDCVAQGGIWESDSARDNLCVDLCAGTTKTECGICFSSRVVGNGRDCGTTPVVGSPCNRTCGQLCWAQQNPQYWIFSAYRCKQP